LKLLREEEELVLNRELTDGGGENCKDGNKLLLLFRLLISPV
jgi:hypothetical protein